MPRSSPFREPILHVLSLHPDGLNIRTLQEEINLGSARGDRGFCDYGNLWRIVDLFKFYGYITKQEYMGAVICKITSEGRVKLREMLRAKNNSLEENE